MRFNVVPIGSICRLEKKLITPIEGVNYTLFSLPAFDNNKIPEKTDGKDIKSSKFVLEPNTILYNKLNVNFRRVWNIGSKVPDNSICSTEFFPLKVNSSIIQDYLYYFLCSDEFTERMNNLRKGTSNSQQRIDINAVFKYDIPLPDLITQNKIATILSSIDKKIEINDAINRNLEQILEAIFKSWFLDSDSVPTGWEHKTFGDVCHNLKEKVLDDNRIVLSAINTGELRPSKEYFTKQVFSKDIKNYLKVPMKAFAYNPARVNIGSIGLNMFDYEGCVSPVYVVFNVEPGYEAYFNYLIKTNVFKEEVKTRASGSVRQTLSYKDLALIELTYPSKDVAQKFNELFWLFQDIKNRNTAETAKLTQLRDYLLPKLMSGELDVSELDI